MRGAWFLVLALVGGLLVTGVLAYVVLYPHSLGIEYVGGKYHSVIQFTGQDPEGFYLGKIFYIKDGVEHSGYWGENIRNVLNWIGNNTPENAVFLNWWDYGHMIVGYAQRESINKNPSKEALISVIDPNGYPELDNHTTIVDVAKALTTTNENETLATMTKYNATYILVAAIDGKGKAGWLFNFAGRDFRDYFNFSWQPTHLPFDANMYNDLGKQTVFCRILTNARIYGLTRVYGDENFTICRRST